MSRKHQIKNLSDFALDALANAIVSAVGNAYYHENYDSMFQLTDLDMTVAIVEINSYMECCGCTSTIFEDLLRLILGSEVSPAIRFVCLQMLLNDNVQILITENFPYPYYDKILQIIAIQGKGLKYLNLKGIWVKNESMCFMYNIVRNLQKLQKLIIPYIANDDLLKHISLYSKNLRALDISGETDITDLGVHYLCYGVNKNLLTVIDIGTLGDENIHHEEIAALLMGIPNLVSFVTYSYVGRALRYIVDNKDTDFQCKLQYLHDTETKEKVLDAICCCCPDLKLLYLDSPDANILHKISSLKNLQRLKLYKFNCNEIYPVLEVIGKNMQHLTFIKGKGRDALDIGKIVKTCPHLQDLDFYMMDALTYNISSSFLALEGLEILNSPFNSISLKSFICNTTTLKRLAVDFISFTDEEMINILLEHDFYDLEDIWFTTAENLTMKTIETMLLRLPNLSSLGQLAGWKLQADDVALLRAILKSGNSSLSISPANLEIV